MAVLLKYVFHLIHYLSVLDPNFVPALAHGHTEERNTKRSNETHSRF